MFTKLLHITHLPSYDQHFFTIIILSDPLTFSDKLLLVFSVTARNQAIYGSLRKEWKSIQIRHSQPTPKRSPKTISWTTFKCCLLGDLTYNYILYYILFIFILNAHEQFVFFLCNMSHEMLLRMLLMCFWLTLYINLYDLYKHLVVNQIFTCFLLQNSNTAEMALKYGIFFRKLNINFVHVTADCSVFIYNADVKH